MTDKLKEKEEFRYAPIGVFDSNFGGLVSKRIMLSEFQTDHLFGDTARSFSFVSRSSAFTVKIVTIVIACINGCSLNRSTGI